MWTEGSDMNITREQRINDNPPVSKLHMCKIGNGDQKSGY